MYKLAYARTHAPPHTHTPLWSLAGTPIDATKTATSPMVQSRTHAVAKCFLQAHMLRKRASTRKQLNEMSTCAPTSKNKRR